MHHVWYWYSDALMGIVCQTEKPLNTANNGMSEPIANESVMSFWEHLEELRWVIFKCLLALVIAMLVCLGITDRLWGLMLRSVQAMENAVKIIEGGPVIAVIVRLKLARLGLVKADRLAKVRPYAVVAVFVAAALLTPPDPFTQVMLGLPLLILYEVSILVARLVEPKSRETG